VAKIIFDFDGTIANTFDYAVDFLSQESTRGPVNRDQRAALHGLSMAGIARSLGIPWRRMPGLFFKGRHRMSPAMDNIEPFDGMADIVRELHSKRHEMYILSTNTTRNINKFLRRHKLEKSFKHVYGGVGMFGKTPALRRLLLEQHIETRKAVYIGDELRDVMAAQALGVRVIAVTWGFARHDDLKAKGPTGMAKKPADIIRLIKTI
jgi:phosphoglycolate phosphatase